MIITGRRIPGALIMLTGVTFRWDVVDTLAMGMLSLFYFQHYWQRSLLSFLLGHFRHLQFTS